MSKARAKLLGFIVRELFACCGTALGAGERPHVYTLPCDYPALITREREWTSESGPVSVRALASLTENGIST